jgi:hypothetical protein
MSCLLRQGFIAALAPNGAPNLDIVVSTIDGLFQSGIQVKTRRGVGGDRGWHMGRKHEDIISPSLFYCFVDFQSDFTKLPLAFVVPSAVVARAVKSSHAMWLAKPGAKGQPHKDSNMRRFLPDYAKVFSLGPNPYPDGWLAKYDGNWKQLIHI